MHFMEKKLYPPFLSLSSFFKARGGKGSLAKSTFPPAPFRETFSQIELQCYVEEWRGVFEESLSGSWLFPAPALQSRTESRVVNGASKPSRTWTKRVASFGCSRRNSKRVGREFWPWLCFPGLRDSPFVCTCSEDAACILPWLIVTVCSLALCDIYIFSPMCVSLSTQRMYT